MKEEEEKKVAEAKVSRVQGTMRISRRFTVIMIVVSLLKSQFPTCTPPLPLSLSPFSIQAAEKAKKAAEAEVSRLGITFVLHESSQLSV